MSFPNPLADPRRDVSRFTGRATTHSSFSSFSSSEGPLAAGLHTIEHNSIDIDVFYEPAESDTTIVVFHAALSRPDVTLPMFTGSRVTQDGPVNRIYVSDPSLYYHPELTLGWYAGGNDCPLQRVLPLILRRFVRDAGGSRLMFFGASGGGFAAMYYSHHFEGSLALAINPQTILREFPSYTLRRYTELAFPGAPQREVLDNTICSDLRTLYAGGFPNYVVYVQNERDDHMQKHLAPFVEAVGPSDRLHVTTGDWGEGHVPPPADEIREIVSNLTQAQGPWDEVMADYREANASVV